MTTTTISAAAKAAAARRLANRVAPPPGQIEGEALHLATDALLGRSGPAVVVVAATLLFVLAIAIPPVLAFTLRRRKQTK